ncbi:MAG: THUMP domain-containing protein [Pseudanabaenaceae cyanobacterium bins.68]|nr:THUMP domain-containing protein [Pseudanabaenaceae cyanobacterium bins.68]
MAEYYATVARGLEAIAAQELTELGASQVEPGFCGVAFRGDRELLYKVNLWARLPFRILWQLANFRCADAEDLYQEVKAIPWQQYLTPAQTLAVDVSGKSDSLNHSHFSALQVKNAIVDQQQQQFGDRSSVDTQDPDLKINLHIGKDHCVLSLDSSGQSLHRRGYRPAMGAAPLKESLAAALIKLSGWQPHQAFYDPLCGSGTLPLEASLIALRVAPGLFRPRFGFETWRDFDLELLDRLILAAEQAQLQQLPAPIWGTDHNPQIIQQAIANSKQSGVDAQVYLGLLDLAEATPPAPTGILICNPPYGERLGKNQDLADFYKLLGDVLKQRFKGWTAYVLSGNKELALAIGLKSSQRIPIYNGTLSCQLMRYELY